MISPTLRRMLRPVTWGGLLCLLVLSLLHLKVSLDVERLYRPYIYENAYDLPPSQVIRASTLNHDTAAATLVWLSAVQYAAEANVVRRKATDATKYGRTMVELDPFFYDVYSWQSSARMMIAGYPDTDDIAAVNDILKYGMRYFPNDWQLPYEVVVNYIGFSRDLDRQTRIEQVRDGAEHAAIAASKEGSPEVLGLLAASFNLKLRRLEQGFKENQKVEVELTPEDRELLIKLYLSHPSDSLRKYILRRLEAVDEGQRVVQRLQDHAERFEQAYEDSDLQYVPVALVTLLDDSLEDPAAAND
jgi:hypothetical protein